MRIATKLNWCSKIVIDDKFMDIVKFSLEISEVQ